MYHPQSSRSADADLFLFLQNLRFFEVMLSVKNKQKINKKANLTIENQFTYIYELISAADDDGCGLALSC